MVKLQIADAATKRCAIRREIARSQESRYDHRLHGLLLVSAGRSCREAARLLGEHTATVQRWLRRFNHGGLDALREGARPGRPPLLDAKDRRRLQGELRKRPSDFGLAAATWSGPVLCLHIRRHYSVDLGVRQCQRLLR